ncbi:sensor domain-containing diguanylate cyclase [Thermosulfidibacter takaii]|uniref:sensor domain-containing diguanylate cyclase n=1 Tax=Thermosulfidibacter takaii TaxID=412593 RepID=UPI00130DF441|nr:diguanylate cyclase [Thermosulfidibacter takaii]
MLILNVISLLSVFLLYVFFVTYHVHKSRQLIINVFEEGADSLVNTILSTNRESISNMLNSFAMWTEMAERVAKRDKEWVQDMFFKDPQVEKFFDLRAVCFKDGNCWWDDSEEKVEKERILRIRDYLRNRYPRGTVIDMPLTFAFKLESSVYLVGVCPISDDAGRVISYDFILLGKDLKKISKIYLDYVLDLSFEQPRVHTWMKVFPLKDYHGDLQGYLVVEPHRNLVENLRLLEEASLVFVFLSLMVVLFSAWYTKRTEGKLKMYFQEILESLKQIEFYRADFSEIDRIVKEGPVEIGEIAKQVAILGRSISAKVMRDPLTRILNRGAFFARLEEEIQRARRYNRPISLAIADIDDFKKVNDTYGHAVGDVVLSKIAYCISQNIRRFEVVGRIGGEEFGVIFPESNLQSAMQACEKLRRLIENLEIKSNGKEIKVTVSFGVTQLKETDTLQSFFERADAALYQAKRLGKNRVESIY